MSAGKDGDLLLTLGVLEGRQTPTNDDQTMTWLRHTTKPQGHNVKGQCGQIDLALLNDPPLTLSEIVHRVSAATGTECTEKRVEDHFKHLEEFWNGDMEPHHLKLKKENGRWFFDREWLRQQVLQGAVLQYEEPTDPVAETDWDAHQ